MPLSHNAKGLTTDDAKRRALEFGKNILPKAKVTPVWQIFLFQFKSPIIFLLLLAAVISFLLGQIVDTIFILITILLNGLFGFYQEMKAKNELATLRKLVVLTTRVIRDGRETQIQAEDLVPGDFVILSEGDRIPADGKIVSSKNLTINEASLTGESVPVEKGVGDEIYLATTVLSGRAEFEISQIGEKTKFGQIALSLSQINEEKTPLEIKISDLGQKLTLGVIAIIILVFAIGLFQNRDLPTLFFLSVALAVAAIPEGLPAVMTISLAVGVRKLALRKAIVKRLAATETLGSIDVILTDKTGTLTKNEMTVKEIYTSTGKLYSVSGVGYNFDGKIENFDPNDPVLSKILATCVHCNNSSLAPIKDHGGLTILGDTTEGALLILARKAGIDYEELRKSHQISDDLPFDSERRLMTVVVEKEVYTKGATEEILKICSGLSDSQKEEILMQISSLGKHGFRVLGLAHKTLDKNAKNSDLEKDLNFLGLVALLDPPRPEVKAAIENCRKAGISVVMLTGDSGETARSISEQIGLLTEGQELISGEQLELYTDEVLEQNLLKIGVFSRVTPNNKLRIVEAYQRLGKIVAVTGDGVNDSPALKKAQVGIAMGITGTDVAKEASDLIITDDNFATIVAAIEEGRIIFVNLVKSIKYLLACNLGEVATIFLALVVGLPMPLSPLAILWMNIVTDSLPAFALAIDTNKDGLAKLARDRLGTGTNFINRTGGQHILLTGLGLGMGALLIFYLLLPLGINQARLTTFTFLVVAQLGIAFLVRGKNHSFGDNKTLILSVVLGVIFQATILLVPQIREIFY